MFRAASPRSSAAIDASARRPDPVEVDYRARVCLTSGRVTAWRAELRQPGDLRTGDARSARPGGASLVLLGGTLLAQACVEARYWPECLASVAVSRRQLVSGVVLEQLDAALAHSGLQPSRLELILVDVGPGALDVPLLRTIWALRDRGVGLMLRDVGCDGSGLAVLRRVPATALAFPPRAIGLACGCPDEAAFLRALVTAAQTLDLTVVAGGVETEQHRTVAAALGCCEADGPLFHALSPADTAAAQTGAGTGAGTGARTGSGPSATVGNGGNDTCAAAGSPPELRHECHTLSY